MLEIQGLIQGTAYSALKWKVTSSRDMARVQCYAKLPFQDLSEEGKLQARQKGYSENDSIGVLILAERNGTTTSQMLSKKEPQAIEWVRPVRTEQQEKTTCFIATAAYGTPLAAEILVLKQFRDQHLMRSEFGKAVIRVYETAGPPIAFLVARSTGLRFAVRILVAGICSLVKRFKSEVVDEHL